jgi:hypothetical protein
MEQWIEHRAPKQCPTCGSTFTRSPGLGRCPYCTLSPEERAVSPFEGAVPCPPDCCLQEAS